MQGVTERAGFHTLLFLSMYLNGGGGLNNLGNLAGIGSATNVMIAAFAGKGKWPKSKFRGKFDKRGGGGGGGGLERRAMYECGKGKRAPNDGPTSGGGSALAIG